MKNKFIIPSLLLTVGTLFVSCNSDVSDDNDTVITEISSSNLSGFIDSEAFTPATTYWETSVVNGVPSYEIKFFIEVEECDEYVGLGDVFFVIPSETELTTGNYEGAKLYFYDESTATISLATAEVIIEEVTATTITGRAKGGGTLWQLIRKMYK